MATSGLLMVVTLLIIAAVMYTLLTLWLKIWDATLPRRKCEKLDARKRSWNPRIEHFYNFVLHLMLKHQMLCLGGHVVAYQLS